MKNLEYLKNLNKVQHEAVSYLDGPLILAALALEKQSISIQNCTYYRNKKGFSNQILAVIHNKAAKEMRIEY